MAQHQSQNYLETANFDSLFEGFRVIDANNARGIALVISKNVPTTTPGNSVAGYAPGCLFISTVANGAIWTNSGSATSTTWTQISAGSGIDLADNVPITFGTGADVTIQFDGTDLVIAGAGSTKIRNRLMFDTPTPQTATSTASLTDAQMLGGILVATPSATATYTVRTGAQIEAALSATLANDDSFDLTIINLGSAGDIITMAVATGVTFVGSLTIDDAGADINSSGTFRFRRTAADTFVGYRIN